MTTVRGTRTAAHTLYRFCFSLRKITATIMLLVAVRSVKDIRGRECILRKNLEIS